MSGLSLSSLLSNDGFHPNKIGYKLMADGLFSTLEEYKDKLVKIWK
jgi:lysophospholipase L1-like esterase